MRRWNLHGKLLILILFVLSLKQGLLWARTIDITSLAGEAAALNPGSTFSELPEAPPVPAILRERSKSFCSKIETKVLELSKEMICRVPLLHKECETLNDTVVSVSDILNHGRVRVRGISLPHKIKIDREAFIGDCEYIQDTIRERKRSKTAKGFKLAGAKSVDLYLAALYMPIIAHELSHKYTQKILPGIGYTFDNELRAHVIQAIAFGAAYDFIFKNDDIIIRIANLWTAIDQGNLAIEWRDGGPDGIRKWIRPGYQRLVWLIKDNIEEFDKQAQIQPLDRLEKLLQDYTEANAKGTSTKDLDAALRVEAFWLDVGETKDYIEQLKAERDFWSDNSKISRAREFFKNDYCQAWKMWAEQFPERSLRLPEKPPGISDQCWKEIHEHST